MATTRRLYINDRNFGIIHIDYIVDEQPALAALEALKAEKVIGYDTETYPKPQYRHREKAGLRMCENLPRLVQLGTESQVYLFDLMFLPDSFIPALKEFLELELPVKTAHNAKFDVKVARKHFGVEHFGRVCCTELMARQVKCGLNTFHVSLEKAVLEHLNISLDKSAQLSDWSQPTLTDHQLKYAARDVVAALRLRSRLLVQVKELGIEKAVKIDFDTIDPVASMELAGFPLDKNMWLKTDAEMSRKKDEVTDQLHDLIRRDIIPQQALFSAAPLATKKKHSTKISSTKKIQEFLEALDIEVPEKTDRKTRKVSKTTNSDALETIQDQHEMIPLLITWRELAKRSSSYGADYIEDYVCPECNRIHADYDPQKTKTARFACEYPNLQQIPGIDDYRACFRPSAAPLYPNSVFVGADYGQIELRTAAEFTGDPGYIAAFNSGEDFHTQTAKMIAENPDDPAEVKAMRTPAKRINFGIIYGLGARRLAAQLGIPVDREDAQQRWLAGKLKGVPTPDEWFAEEHDDQDFEPWQTVPTATDYMDKYIARFDVLMQGLTAYGKETARNGQIRTWTGRLVKFIVDRKDKGSVAQAERNGKNTPIQGGAGEVLKIALRYIFDEIWQRKLRARIVNIIHDEIIIEAHPDDAEAVKELQERLMLKAEALILTKVPCDVEAKIMTSWADK